MLIQNPIKENISKGKWKFLQYIYDRKYNNLKKMFFPSIFKLEVSEIKNFQINKF